MASHVLQMQSHFITQALGHKRKERLEKIRAGIPLDSSDEELHGDHEELKEEEESKVKETVTGILNEFKE